MNCTIRSANNQNLFFSESLFSKSLEYSGFKTPYLWSCLSYQHKIFTNIFTTPIQPSHYCGVPAVKLRCPEISVHIPSFLKYKKKEKKKAHNRTTDCVQSHIDCKSQMSRADVTIAPSIEAQMQWTIFKFVYNVYNV